MVYLNLQCLSSDTKESVTAPAKEANANNMTNAKITSHTVKSDCVALDVFGEVDPVAKLPKILVREGRRLTELLIQTSWEDIVISFYKYENFGAADDIPMIMQKDSLEPTDILRLFYWFFHGARECDNGDTLFEKLAQRGNPFDSITGSSLRLHCLFGQLLNISPYSSSQLRCLIQSINLSYL